MTKPQSSDLQSAIARAAELVKDLPPDLRQVAFGKAFDALTSADLPTATSAATGSGKTASNRGTAASATSNPAADTLLEALDSTSHPEIVDGKPARELALRVLKAARDSANVEWLASATVWALLRDKFRVSIKLNAVNMALFRAGRLVDRRKQGDGYVYRIMSAGESAIARVGIKPTGPKKTAARKLSGGAAKARDNVAARKGPSGVKVDKDVRSQTKRAMRATGRLGPKAMLEALITSGYFTERRTIGDIIAHVEVKQARKVKATDLSPALGRLQREEKLDRERNAQGQYEYKRHPKHS